MGFVQYKPPKDLSEEVRQKIRDLENVSKSQLEYLKNSYGFVQSRWQAERLKTIFCLHLAFRKDLQKIWKMPGYAHCNTINFILYTLLAGSRFFAEEDIKIKYVFFNAVPHQYIKVKVGEKWLDIDPSLNYVKGLPFGTRTTKWFG